MPSPTSSVDLLGLIRKSGVLRGDALDALTRNGSPADPKALARALVRDGQLTAFQARMLLSGKHSGLKLGQYVVRDEIGKGGMGLVYLARHEALKRPVALKVLPPQMAGSESLAVQRFLREARAAAALDHPNIVRIFDVDRQGPVHFLAMEFIDGIPLDAMLNAEGPLPPDRLARLLVQAAAGLQHAHEKGFVHRDIKPANLILGRDGVLKILDMGLARTGSDEDQVTEKVDKRAVVGTADFMAPEQALGDRTDARTDVYSLGATAYVLASGRLPLAGTPHQKMLQLQMTDPLRLELVRPGFPPGLAAIIARMLAKKPANRYQSAADAGDAIARWADGPAPTAPQPIPVITPVNAEVVTARGPAKTQTRTAPSTPTVPPTPTRLKSPDPTEPAVPVRKKKRRKSKAKDDGWELYAVALGAFSFIFVCGLIILSVRSRMADVISSPPATNPAPTVVEPAPVRPPEPAS